jgi:hypothetical protein
MYEEESAMPCLHFYLEMETPVKICQTTWYIPGHNNHLLYCLNPVMKV